MLGGREMLGGQQTPNGREIFGGRQTLGAESNPHEHTEGHLEALVEVVNDSIELPARRGGRGRGGSSARARADRTIRSMRKRSRRQDTKRKDETALVGALNGLGSRIGGAMEQFVAASVNQERQVASVPTAAVNDEVARDDARRAMHAVEQVNERLDGFETVMKKENRETKDLLRMVLDRLPAGSSGPS